MCIWDIWILLDKTELKTYSASPGGAGADINEINICNIV